MSESRYRGSPPPARREEPSYRVLRPQRDGPLKVTLLAEGIFGVVTHYVWSEQRQRAETVPCTLYEGECRVHREKREWCGWMPVWDHAADGRAVLRLSPLEADALVAVLGKEGAWMHALVTITPKVSNKGKFVLVERVLHGTPPMRIGPHGMEATICAVLGCARVPMQGPTVADLREEGAQG